MNNTINIRQYNDAVSPFGKDKNKDLEYLIKSIDKNSPELDKHLICKALNVAYDLHKGQRRRSGVPYYVHPLSVALILIEELKTSDTSMVVAALLHDILEDIPNIDNIFIEKEFDKDVADLVDGITKIAHTGLRSEIQKNKAATLRKLFLSIIKDVRIFIIKLCDRLHNLRTLEYLPAKKRVEIAKETLSFYMPFAHKLNMTKIGKELESRSFLFYNFNQYRKIVEYLAEKKRNFTEYMFMFVDSIKTCLNRNGFSYNLSIANKQEYEIFLMMQEREDIEDIDNFFSLLIVLDSDNKKDCYVANKALENEFSSSNIVDYVTNSKANWYHSVNAELYGPDGKVEVIIRTKETAEHDFIRNITHKNKNSFNALNISEEDLKLWGNWMQDVIENENDNATQTIWELLKNNVFDTGITVYTKDSQPINLPQKATLIDFAFALSNEIGIHAITGRVNNVIKNIFKELENGDVVEVMTSIKCNPDSSWLNHIVSFKATCHLYNYFKTDYHLKSKKTAVIKQNKSSLIKISGIEKEGILTEVMDEIGRDKIKRVSLAPAYNSFEVAVETQFLNKDDINLYFINLLKIQGIRSIVIN